MGHEPEPLSSQTPQTPQDSVVTTPPALITQSIDQIVLVQLLTTTPIMTSTLVRAPSPYHLDPSPNLQHNPSLNRAKITTQLLSATPTPTHTTNNCLATPLSYYDLTSPFLTPTKSRVTCSSNCDSARLILKLRGSPFSTPLLFPTKKRIRSPLTTLSSDFSLSSEEKMKVKHHTTIRSPIPSPRFVPTRTDRRSPRPPIQLKQWVPRSAARRRLQRRRLNSIPYSCPATRLLLASYACQHSRESGTSLK